jgi:hypothetical protein
VVNTTRVDMLVFAFKATKDFPGVVGRDVVDRMDAIAELGYVPDRPLDEHVLVVDEDDADDLLLGD